MKAKTAKEVLIAAKWILTHFDWCQNSWYVATDGQLIGEEYFITTGQKQLKCCCLHGAVDLVECEVPARIGAIGLLERNLGLDYDGIITWNDVKGRTKKQVINLLNLAIKKAP